MRSRGTSRRSNVLAAALLPGILLFAATAPSDPAAPALKNGGPLVAQFVPATPANVVWGGFPIDMPAVATVVPGEVVMIDAISQSGATSSAADPVTYFGAFGVEPDEVLDDVVGFWNSIPSRTRFGPHILTGPIYIEGAEPGDTIEMQILDVYQRVDYGVNGTSPTGGVFSTSYPGFREGDPPLDIPPTPPGAFVFPDVRNHLYRTAKVSGRDVALFSDTIHVPLRPFFGVMAVAPPTGQFIGNTPDSPPPETGVQSSTQPWNFGGNVDSHLIRKGVKYYLPVFQTGGQMFFGDTHSVQGDGEVSGTAIEHSLGGVFRFIVHKNTGQQWPYLENEDYYIMMGMDWDLDRAARNATEQAIQFLVEKKGLTVPKAFSLCSVGVDLVVSEVVDRTQVVSALIPKSYFGE